jgi:YD repeat-containing protein
MSASMPLDDLLLQRLPLPLAQLYGRAHNAKTALELHQTAYYLWEAALKLLGAVAVVEYAERGLADPQLEERLQSLARPSLGHWWEFVRRLLPVLADAGDSGFVGARDLLLGRTRDDLPRTAGLDAALTEALEGRSPARSVVRLSELFDRLGRYRNREVGHGAAGQRPTAFYERMGRALLTGVPELLGRLDVLAGRHLVYVAEVRGRPDGSWLVERAGLSGPSPRRLEPLHLTGVLAAQLPRPERLYLEADGGRPPVSLHPLVVFEPEAGEVLFYSARRGRQRAEYLSYTSGRTVEGADTAGEQRALLARVLGVPVEADTVVRWEARSVAEEAAEAAAGPIPTAPRQVGDFELLSKLGQGGMGVVYRAWQPSLGRQVALKCLSQSGDQKAEARFAREIRALGRVEHPHLVRIFTSGSAGDQWFYAMELLEGAPLGAVCEALHSRTPQPTAVDWPTWVEAISSACLETHRAEKPLGPVPAGEPGALAPGEGQRLPPGANAPGSPGNYVRHVAGLVRQVAEAAHALHEAGIVHRDIKPGNIMLTPDGQKAVLTDLGLAQLSDEVAGKLTRTRQFVGTLRYASPEQVLAAGPVDRRSDVYSLGATLWELLTLRPLYGATDQTPTPELMQRIQYAEVEAPRRFNPRVSRDLEAVVLRCLEKDPKRRYATAAELAEDLRRVLDGEPVRARPVGWLRRTVRRVRRRPGRALAVAGVLALLLAAAGGYWYWDAHYRVKVEYYAHITQRWGAMEGVTPLTPEQVRRRQNSYRITRQGGHVLKVEAVNGLGRPRNLNLRGYIDDLEGEEGQPVRQVEYVWDADGRVAQEVYRDRSGEVLRILHYTTPTLGHYTDRKGFPRARSACGAGYVQMERDASGWDVACRYLGLDGRPQPGQDGTYGFRITRDSRGLWRAISYLGKGDRPAANGRGVARLTCRRNATGQFVEQAYWGLDGRPVVSRAGGARYAFAYDADGNQTLAEWFGPDGRLTRGKEGYARRHTRYDESGNEVAEWYEDERGRPVRCKNGYTRIAYVPDQRGYPVEWSYADEKGRPTRDRHGVARVKARYDDLGRVTEWRYSDGRGRPTPNNDGYARLAVRFDGRGNRVEAAFFDVNGRPAWHKEGYVRKTARFDDRGNQVGSAYFGPDGKPVRSKDGYARWTAEYDDGGNCVARAYWDGEGRPTLHVEGNAAYRARFDERGNRIEITYLDKAGRPVRVKGGYARIDHKFDEHGRLIEAAYLDEAGKPIRQRKGYARQTLRYDSHGRIVAVAYWGEHGEPARHRSGNVGYTARYDERGNRTEEAYLNKDGKLMRLRGGYAGSTVKYDARDNPIEMAFFDERRRPVQTQEGYVRKTARYDERDRLIEVAYWDADGKPAPHATAGNVRFTAKYDERGYRTEEAYFDRDGNLFCTSDGCARVTMHHDARGNVIGKEYWDEQGRPAPNASGGNVRLTTKYDDHGRLIEQAYFGKDGKLMRLRDQGYARYTTRYDDRGNPVEKAFYDEHGNLTPTTANGCVRVTSRYDERGNCVETTVLGPDGQRARARNGISRETSRFDSRDNLIERTLFDEADRLVRNQFGWARVKMEYDDRNTCIAMSYFDTDGAPLRTRVVVKQVYRGSQAERLGLQSGDVLLAYDVREVKEMFRFISGRNREDARDPPRPLLLRRGGKTLTVKVRPGLLGVELDNQVVRDKETAPQRPAPEGARQK